MRKAGSSGSALTIILIGIVLLAALVGAVVNNFNGGNAALSRQTQDTLASDILMSAAAIEKGVNKLIAQDNSESRLSFTRAASDGYELTPSETDAEKLFHVSGGGVQYLSPPPRALDTTRASETNYNSWLFTGANNVSGNGSASEGDLVAMLPFVNKSVCILINERLGVTNPSGNPPVEANTMNVTTKFTGSFSAAQTIAVTGAHTDGRKAACIEGTQNESAVSIAGRYYFYYVLWPR